MKLGSFDLRRLLPKEVVTLKLQVSDEQIREAGGQDKLGFKVSNLELSLPKGVMNIAFSTQRTPYIRVMYFVQHTDKAAIIKWLTGNDIPFTSDF